MWLFLVARCFFVMLRRTAVAAALQLQLLNCCVVCVRRQCTPSPFSFFFAFTLLF
jgi:hypothetical protein